MGLGKDYEERIKSIETKALFIISTFKWKHMPSWTIYKIKEWCPGI